MNYLKFWGTRGSCSVSGKEMLKHGGNTCSLEISYQSTRVIIDAGTGIRPLGLELLEKGDRKIHLFIGHSHWDHLIGFPFFAPIFQAGKQIHIWFPEGMPRPGRDLFKELFSIEFFPVHLEQIEAELHFHTSHPKTPINIESLKIDFHQTNHPGTTHCFKIITPKQKIGYVTDNEMLQGYHGPIGEVPDEVFEPHLDLVDFLSDCDIIVHEAQYTAKEYTEKVGWGHSSIPNALTLIQKTRCKHWIVTHHDPTHTDAELKSLLKETEKLIAEHQIPCKVEFAFDGMELLLA